MKPTEMQIKPATRTGVRPLIGLYSESGCGKTYSSLLLARGFVGPKGRVVMIDTESGRGSLYADVPVFGGYDVLELREPFSPQRYIEAIQAVEQSGATLGIIDSGSHEWEGMSGVLDMAMLNEEKSGKQGLHNWRVPKLEHAKFMLKLLQSSVPWIVCLRAKYKTRQGKDRTGKTEIVKDDYTTPIQAEDFIFEMTVHGEILSDHTFKLTKCSHPDLRRCMPNNEAMKIEHGQLLAEWCSTPGVQKPKESDQRSLVRELWGILESVRGAEKNWNGAEIWLVGNQIISDEESVLKMMPERLREVIDASRDKLEGTPVI